MQVGVGAQVDALLAFPFRGGETLIRSVHPELSLPSSLLGEWPQWERIKTDALPKITSEPVNTSGRDSFPLLSSKEFYL